MSSINKELEENIKELEKKLAEHQLLLDSISYYRDDERISIGQIIGKVNGVRGVNVKNTAWKSFINPNIELVDYQLISALTDIEEGKGNMAMQVNKMIDFVYSNIGYSDDTNKQLFHMIIGDLMYTENSLLKSHKNFLELAKE